MTRDVKTARAYSESSTFTVKDIKDPIKLAQMRSTTLRDDFFNEVIAVRREDGAADHFRGKAGEMESGERASVDPLHAKTIAQLMEFLQEGDFSADVVGFRAGKRVARSIWQALPTSRYAWVTEPSTRIYMQDGAFVQPDIVGYDAQRFTRGPRNPVVVIEVVHAHWPDYPTWLHLLQLSRMNHLILFYFVGEGRESAWLNFVARRDGRKLVVSCHLHEGVVRWKDAALTPVIELDPRQSYEWIKERVFAAIDAEVDRASKKASK